MDATAQISTSPTERAPFRQRASLSGGKPFVLLLEDDQYIGAIIWKLLAKFEFEVICAPSGREGLEMASSLRPDFVILDLGLPDMSGLEICRRLKADPETLALPVVFFSAQASLAVEALASGAAAFLEKPKDIGKLPFCLCGILSARTAKSPGI
jgi:DNA-binding response OmpR family regulator